MYTSLAGRAEAIQTSLANLLHINPTPQSSTAPDSFAAARVHVKPATPVGCSASVTFHEAMWVSGDNSRNTGPHLAWVHIID
jgi:hypothetical protein